MEITQEQKLYAEVVQKAWEDGQFKSELVANPAAAIEHLTGYKISLPLGHTLVVKDQTEETIVYLNIPRKPNLEELELTEEQLEMVAGGLTPTVIPVCYAVGIGFMAGVAFIGGCAAVGAVNH